MGISAKEAAEQVGMSKAGILKAVKTGKLSAAKDHNGEWSIEPVELFRVYTPVSTNGHTKVVASPQPVGAEVDRVEIRLLRERLADKDDQIRDLRQRLDAEAEERRRISLMLESATAKRSWWARLVGR